MQDITALHPTLQTKLAQLQTLCSNNGITIGISECVRTVAEQDALYAKGRTTAGSIVTNAKGSTYSSMHQWGVAFDFYLKVDVNGDGKVNSADSYNDSTGLFEKVGALGKSIGLEWGGSWTKPVDRPHFQLPDWGSTATKLKAQYGTPEKFMATWKSGTTTTSTATTTTTTTTTYAVGDVVNVSSYYSASSDPVSKAIIKTVSNATIAEIVTGAANPYRLDKSGKTVGYCNAGDIRTKVSSATTTNSAATQTSTTTDYSKNTVESAKTKNAQYAGTYKTTANLNLRSGAGSNKNIITTIPKGDSVTCYGYYTEVSGTPWYLVAYGKYTGYCSSAYLKK